MSSPNTTISSQGVVQEVLRSPDSEGDAEGESVVTVNVDNVTSYATPCTSKAFLATSTFYGKKMGTKKGYLSSEIRREKSREVQWANLVFPNFTGKKLMLVAG